MDFKLDITVPYQGFQGERWSNLCWASIVSALVSFYSRQPYDIGSVLRKVLRKRDLEPDVDDVEYDLNEALCSFGISHEFFEVDASTPFVSFHTRIIEHVDSGHPVVLQLHKRSGATHFVIVLGYTQKDDVKKTIYTIGDPSGAFDKRTGENIPGQNTELKAKNKTYDQMTIVGVGLIKHEDCHPSELALSSGSRRRHRCASCQSRVISYVTTRAPTNYRKGAESKRSRSGVRV